MLKKQVLKFLFYSLGFSLMISCGKVVQDVKSETNSNYFKIQTTLTVTPPPKPKLSVDDASKKTENASSTEETNKDTPPKKDISSTPSETAAPITKTSDSPEKKATEKVLGIPNMPYSDTLYHAVYGLKSNGQSKLLSWGQASIETSILKNVVSRSSYSYTKRGIKVNKSDHNISYLKYNPDKHQWSMDSSKVLRDDFVSYLVAAFSDKYIYRLYWIDEKNATENNSITVNLDGYNTFIALLNWYQYRDNPKSIFSFFHFSTFYDEGLYKLIYKAPPVNRTESFDPKKPSFVFDRKLEDELINIYNLASIDTVEATQYIQELPITLLSDKAKDTISKKIMTLKKAGFFDKKTLQDKEPSKKN